MKAGIYSLGERHLVTAGNDYYIAPGAQVIGSVILGAGASLWFNCVLRADDERIEIGAGTNIQDGTVIHCDVHEPTVIGQNVTVGHMAMLHSCFIGDETLIGNGAIVLDRAVIGRHCIIAAGALVTPDRQIPDGSVVMGAPGKVVRPVNEKDLEMIAHGHASYRARAQRFIAQLRPGPGHALSDSAAS
jgi:carbonic anhydrase/acetyltransferase-like protein (isoleucine patch superfamily)